MKFVFLFLSLVSIFLSHCRELELGDRNVFTQKLQRNYFLKNTTIAEFVRRQSAYLKIKYLGTDENVTLNDFSNAQYTMPITIGDPPQTFQVSS